MFYYPAAARKRRKRGSSRVFAVLIAFGLLSGGIAYAVTTPPVVGLVVSADSGHNSPRRLAHASLSGPAFVFLAGDTADRVSTVSYYLDDPVASKTPTSISSSAPFDMGDLNVSTLSAGTHNLLAVLKSPDGSEHDLFARFATGGAESTAPTSTTPTTAAPTVPPQATPTASGRMQPPVGANLISDLTLRSSWSDESSSATISQLSETGPSGDPVLRNTLVDGQTGASSGVPSERSDLAGPDVPLDSTQWMIWDQRFINLPDTDLDRWQLMGPNEIHGDTLDQATVMPEVGPDKHQRLNANAGLPATRYFDLGAITLSEWHQWKMGIHYTNQSNGWIELWRDGVQVVRIDGQTTSEDRNGYWKLANYRNSDINGTSTYDVSGVKIYG